MTDTIDTPTGDEDNSYRANLRRYREQFPLLDEYLKVLDLFATKDVQPITEPMKGGVDVHQATKIALSRLGRDCDNDMAYWAFSYIEKLRHEVDSMSDQPEPTVSSVLIDHFWPTWGHLPTVAQWEEEMEDDKDYTAKELFDAMTREMCELAIKIAMPTLLQWVIDEDERVRLRARGRAEMVGGKAPEASGDVPDEQRFTLDEAAALLRAAAEGGDLP
jgi:hypothetical protein